MDLEYFRIIIELTVLVFIYRELVALRKHDKKIDDSAQLLLKEIDELKNHQKLLVEHTSLLNKSRPVVSNLYTDENEIMELAIQFLKEATECYYLGSFESLAISKSTEIDESELTIQKRKYIKETEDYILNSKKYVRIINFEPSFTNNYDLVLEQNIVFFLKLFNFDSSREINLELYHNNQIPSFSGDFHFRCSEKQLIIRTGGHKNKFTNSALLINDTRVIHEYQQYILSLISSPNTITIGLAELTIMSDYISKNRTQDLKTYLKTLFVSKA